MRCPKCKFISFDDLSTCAKCSNDLSMLSQDLLGTGTEARLPFFLASVVQAQDLEDESFSASQALTAVDDTTMNFDDTLSGQDSLSLDNDDVSIELGEIMPVEFDQIDLSASSFDDSAQLNNISDDDIDFGAPVDLSMSGTFDETELKLSADFDETDLDLSDDFNETEILSSIADDQGEIDLDLTGGFEQNVALDFEDVDLDATGMTLASESPDFSPDETSEELDLDEDLLSALADDDDNFTDNTDDFSIDTSPSKTQKLQTQEALDDSMLLTDDIEGLLDDDLGNIDSDALTDFEDVDFTSSGTPSLDLEDIDVSDLVASSAASPAGHDHDDSDTEINLSSLMDSPNDEEDDDFDLDMLDEEMPEIDLLADDEED